MNDPRKAAQRSQKPSDAGPPQDAKTPAPTNTAEQRGMIGEGTSGEPVADVTEDDPRTTRPGGMIGEGQ